jgi:two-component system sensor histidine kinase KdpD
MLIVAVVTGTLTTKLKLQDQLRMESEREKMRGNLLRAISHDLRTPLTSIYGSCSALIDNHDVLSRDQQLKLLQDMQEDAENLIRIVENLLSVTRVNGEAVTVRKTPTVLEELIDSVLQKFHKRHPNQQITVTIPDDFVSIPMDALLIEQVLINLLENAVYHAYGMTELCLTVRTDSTTAIFEISDDGIGIPKERLEHLFSGQQYRKDTPTDSNRSGMGIGLSVCSAIIKAHNGTITGNNQQGGGAQFRFSLEMEQSDHE